MDDTVEQSASDKRIEEFARRYDNGLDLWTGEPLEGEDADSWLQLEYKLVEPDPTLSDSDKLKLLEVANIIAWAI